MRMSGLCTQAPHLIGLVDCVSIGWDTDRASTPTFNHEWVLTMAPSNYIKED